VPPKKSLRTDQERSPTRAREHPAQRSHEQPIAAAKARPGNTAPEYGELMTKDQDLDVAAAILGGATCERDQPAQQQ
jgi:hypothetical protein